MPPLVLFAGRNNFMQWVSGWPYARFVYIHKWISRVVFMMSIAHAVGMTYNGKGIGKYETRNAKPYVRWGYVALVSMSLMIFKDCCISEEQTMKFSLESIFFSSICHCWYLDSYY